jgi:membrane complex biogenesis BtpA family protein
MVEKELIGVIHLPRLPSTDYKVDYSVSQIADYAVREARLLEEAGFNDVIVENYGDYSFPKRVRDPLTLASISVVVREVVRSTSLKVGVNILRNSGREAYAVAVATGARFIRVNGLVETLVSDSGIIESEAPMLRNISINYPGIEIYADILCKHSGSLYFQTLRTNYEAFSNTDKSPGEEAIREIALDAITRGKASALIVTGPRTGEAPSPQLLGTVKRYSSKPVLVGSGLNPGNAEVLLRIADGAIVGSYIRENGMAGKPIVLERAVKIARIVESIGD